MTTEKKAPTNTTAEVAQDPMRALVTGLPGEIERMEARGQREFTEADVLPVDGLDEERLTALGFRLGDVVPGDPLFRYAEMPPGWRKVATGHSMWSNIVDEQGLTRIEVFYKAAYYDRRAFVRIAPAPSPLDGKGEEGKP
jgi:hypothetical protein